MGGPLPGGGRVAWPPLPGSPARRPANDLLVAASAEALRTGGTKQHAHFWAATGFSAGALSGGGVARRGF